MSTRAQKKSKPAETPPKPHMKRVENTWILLVKDSLFNSSSFNIVTLQHPANGKAAKYALDDEHHKLYEVLTFNEPYRSWFINETVKSDGSIQILSPMNPIFLVLPRLRQQCSSRAVPLEDLLSEKGYDKLIDFIDNMDKVADLKGPADMKAFKYNEEKTLSWLEEKVRKLAKVLREKNVHVTSGVVSATFVASKINNENVDEEFFLKYAYGIISEYLEDKLAEILEKKFNFKADLIESVGKKRKSEVDTNDSNKKIKTEAEDYKVNGINQISNTSDNYQQKAKPLTAKEKARQKAASGTKTISAFFTKK